MTKAFIEPHFPGQRPTLPRVDTTVPPSSQQHSGYDISRERFP
ncbi:hypothetical protein HMPREF9610_02442 [Cutibacterium acnes HL027PA2]|nr:hypothetical protein HMPREF9610_02442 [Cutibacterium acnes HL027PA2]